MPETQPEQCSDGCIICPRCKKQLPGGALICCYCGRTIVRQMPGKMHQRGNGTGTAYRRGKGWECMVTVGFCVDAEGVKRQNRKTKGGFKTKAEALAYVPILMQQNARPAKAPTLCEYWDMYERDELPKLSESKQCAYQIAWKRLEPISRRLVDSLTVADLRNVVREKAPTYYPARDMKVLLNHLFFLAAADGWVSRDLPGFITLPAMNEQKRDAFTEEEQAALWRAYEGGCADAAIPLIMIYTGMMTGEMRRLTAEMVDFQGQKIVGVGLKTEVRKEAPVYLPNAIIPVLQDVIGGRTGRVWTCNNNDFYDRYYAALDVAGVRRLTPYSCRHTTATALAITENIAPETVRKVMRWSTTAMLQRYAHPDDQDALAAVNQIKRL